MIPTYTAITGRMADMIGRIRTLERATTAASVEGTDLCPYWAHYMMAHELAKHGRECPLGSDPCTSTGLCITEYCPSCYAKVWWESQHKHKAQKKRTKP